MLFGDASCEIRRLEPIRVRVDLQGSQRIGFGDAVFVQLVFGHMLDGDFSHSGALTRPAAASKANLWLRWGFGPHNRRVSAKKQTARAPGTEARVAALRKRVLP